jgi:T5SS/PEP-CTERM-associated repeat protein
MLSVLNGGDVDITGAFGVNGANIVVSDAGSTLTTTAALSINGGSALNVAASGNVSAGGALNVGTIGNGTVSVTGNGSSLRAATATIGAASGSTATLTVENGGTFTTGAGLTTVNATGDLNVLSGGTMIVRGNMIVHSSLDIADGGTIILDATAPAVPGAFVETNRLEENSSLATADTAAVPEPGIGALLASGLALLGARRLKERRFSIR